MKISSFSFGKILISDNWLYLLLVRDRISKTYWEESEYEKVC